MNVCMKNRQGCYEEATFDHLFANVWRGGFYLSEVGVRMEGTVIDDDGPGEYCHRVQLGAVLTCATADGHQPQIDLATYVAYTLMHIHL